MLVNQRLYASPLLGMSFLKGWSPFQVKGRKLYLEGARVTLLHA